VFKTVYPSTIACLWLTNTTRMTHFEEYVVILMQICDTRIFTHSLPD